jgi:hypothetical protein
MTLWGFPFSAQILRSCDGSGRSARGRFPRRNLRPLMANEGDFVGYASACVPHSSPLWSNVRANGDSDAGGQGGTPASPRGVSCVRPRVQVRTTVGLSGENRTSLMLADGVHQHNSHAPNRSQHQRTYGGPRFRSSGTSGRRLPERAFGRP